MAGRILPFDGFRAWHSRPIQPSNLYRTASCSRAANPAPTRPARKNRARYVDQNKRPRQLLGATRLRWTPFSLVALPARHVKRRQQAISCRIQRPGTGLARHRAAPVATRSARLRPHYPARLGAGRPCVQVGHQLSELQTYVTYVRVITLVEDGRLYCSSALGTVDVPLARYRNQTGVPVSVKLLSVHRSSLIHPSSSCSMPRATAWVSCTLSKANTLPTCSPMARDTAPSRPSCRSKA
jgi:hypothetical protein